MLFGKKPRVGQILLLFLLLTLLSCHKGEKPRPAIPSQLPDTNRNQPLAADIEPQALWDLRNFSRFAALDFPKMVTNSQADFLSDNEYVVGVSSGGESRAYPVRFLAFHHVINDRIGTSQRAARYIAVTFCSNCNIGICYDPMLHHHPLKFDFYGLYNGIAALCERTTQGVLLLGEGRIVSGPLMGTHFAALPSLDTTWGVWKKLHPATLVMSPDTRFKEFYGSSEKEGKRHQGGSTHTFAAPTVTRGDTRLDPFEMVLAVILPPQATSGRQQKHTALYRAYPLQSLQQSGGVVNDKIGNLPLAVLLDIRTQTAIALSRRLGTQTLTLQARRQKDGTIAFYDRETSTRWNLEGRAVSGPLQGKFLPRLDNHLSQWYGWAASFPNTSIYGNNAPPQPDNLFRGKGKL